MRTYAYELPLSKEAKANLSDAEIISIAVQGYSDVVGNARTIPDHGYIAERIVEQTGVSWGAAILVASSEPRQ